MFPMAARLALYASRSPLFGYTQLNFSLGRSNANLARSGYGGQFPLTFRTTMATALRMEQ